MRSIAHLTAGTLLTLAIGSSAFAAAPCKDAKGKFIKCPPPAAAPAVKCRNAKGAFAKCGTPAAKPTEISFPAR